MNNYTKILLLSLILLVFHEAEVFPAGGLQLGLVEGVEQDDLIFALLEGDGIADVSDFWNTNVKTPLTEEVEALSIGIVRSIASRIKENMLTGLLPTAAIGQAVRDEIARSLDDAPDLVIAQLPTRIHALMSRLFFLNAEEQASLRFTFHDLLAQGAQVETILTRIRSMDNAFRASGRYDPIAIDPRIYGLDVLVEQPVQVIPAPPKILTPSQFKKMKKYVYIRLRNLRTRGTTYTTALPCTPYATDTAETACMICADQDCTLYKNVCTTCSDPNIALCEPCITQTTVKNIVGMVALAATGETGPVHIDFALKLPRCSFCNTPYYNASNFELLERALPIRKRRVIVLQALEAELSKAGEQLPLLLSRLIASSAPLNNIKTHRPSGELVSLKWLALQIYERTAAMRESIREPFSNEAVWRR